MSGAISLERYERVVDALRDVEALLIAALNIDSLERLPADPELHASFNRAHRLLALAQDAATAALKKEDIA